MNRVTCLFSLSRGASCVCEPVVCDTMRRISKRNDDSDDDSDDSEEGMW